MMRKREQGRNCSAAKSKPDDFLRAEYEHMMSSSGPIGFLQILKGLEAEARTTSSSGSLRGASDTRHAKDIAVAGPAGSVRTTGAVWQPTNKGRIAPFCVGNNVCAFPRGLTLTSQTHFTDVKSGVLDFTFSRIQRDFTVDGIYHLP